MWIMCTQRKTKNASPTTPLNLTPRGEKLTLRIFYSTNVFPPQEEWEFSSPTNDTSNLENDLKERGHLTLLPITVSKSH